MTFNTRLPASQPRTLLATISEFRPDPDVRLRAWMDWISAYLDELGVVTTVIVNNGTTNVPDWIDLNHGVDPDDPHLYAGRFNAVCLSPYMPRTAVLEYPGSWRSYSWAVNLAKRMHAQRLIIMQNDFRFLTGRFVRTVQVTRSGCYTPWCPLHRFPEDGFLVICEDKYDETIALTARTDLNGTPSEQLWPITSVWSHLIGDRYSERAKAAVWPPANADFIHQIYGPDPTLT